MPATSAWLAVAEAVVNRWIDSSPRAAQHARRLCGTSLQVDVTGMTGIRAAMSGFRLTLSAESGASPADCTVSGTPMALLQLLRGGTQRSGAAAGMQVHGDAEVANSYRELFTLARPDLEEELAQVIGDLAARRVSRLARGIGSWLASTRRTAGENIAEYLQEEGRDVVGRTELDEFMQGVDDARDMVDRVEARLVRLERRPRVAG